MIQDEQAIFHIFHHFISFLCVKQVLGFSESYFLAGSRKIFARLRATAVTLGSISMTTTSSTSARRWVPTRREGTRGVRALHSALRLKGLFWELSPGPLAPEARIMPLDQTASVWPAKKSSPPQTAAYCSGWPPCQGAGLSQAKRIIRKGFRARAEGHVIQNSPRNASHTIPNRLSSAKCPL